VNSTIISPDGKYIISGGDDKKIKVFDFKTGKCINTFENHTGSVTSLAITRDSRYIVSGSLDNTIKILDIKTVRCIYNIDYKSHISIDENGYFISNDKNIDKYLRISEELLSQRKLTNEEINHFRKKDNFLEIGEIIKKKSIEKIKENSQLFFIVWAVILVLNQIFIFGACFAPYCILAALPHTGIISFFLTIYLIKNNFSDKIKDASNIARQIDTGDFESINKKFREEEFKLKQKMRPKFDDQYTQMGEEYEKYIGLQFEKKGDFVIYNGLIYGIEDKGVDIITISENEKYINLIQCKNWKNKKMTLDDLELVYLKLEKYKSNFFQNYFHLETINDNLFYKKSIEEIEYILKISTNFIFRKTLYISTDKVIDSLISKELKMIKPNIFQYKDMKIVFKNFV
jgi:hypothetical protein